MIIAIIIFSVALIAGLVILNNRRHNKKLRDIDTPPQKRHSALFEKSRRIDEGIKKLSINRPQRNIPVTKHYDNQGQRFYNGDFIPMFTTKRKRNEPRKRRCSNRRGAVNCWCKREQHIFDETGKIIKTIVHSVKPRPA